MIDHPILIGAEKGLFGVVSNPDNFESDVGVVVLNAGILNQTGPFRLHVDLCRRLAAEGKCSVRLDQSGKGDSEPLVGADRYEALKLDYDAVTTEMARYGVRKTVLVGLCSGADDASYIATQRESVIGLVMMDGYARKGLSYIFHHYGPKIVSAKSWQTMFSSIAFRLGAGSSESSDDNGDVLDGLIDVRGWPSHAEMIHRKAEFLARGGRMLCIFTSGQDYYNRVGQLARCFPKDCDTRALSEVYYGDSDHTYSVPSHRSRLVKRISAWVDDEFPSTLKSNVCQSSARSVTDIAGR